MVRKFGDWLRPAGAFAWRWLGGMPPGGVPHTGAGRVTSRRATPPPGTAAGPSGNPFAEIAWDLREIRTEWRELRVRRALGREFRDVERQVLNEQDAEEP